jgi:hypothetical protein
VVSPETWSPTPPPSAMKSRKHKKDPEDPEPTYEIDTQKANTSD